jgi:hypothetical protein
MPAEKTESTPLTDSVDALYEAYGLESHAKYNGENLIDYEPAKLSSFRVFCATKGTILKDPVLLMEQLLITLIFVCAAAPVYHFFRDDVAENRHGEETSIRRWIDAQESKMRAFAMIITPFAAFLLSFYTAICVARWWTMRAGGIGGIKAATVGLELLLYQNVTQEEKVLSAIRRYSRVSLMLIFLWRRKELDTMKEYFVSRELLTEHEADQLLSYNHCLHETIWAWQGSIVTMLRNEGKIKSDPLYSLLLQRCTDGRQAVQLVHTHLAVRVPMQYIHLLGLLVKMHNFVLAVICGCLFGAALRNRETIICAQLFARTLILPFLFNAILLINCDLADPFEGGASDFPGPIYQGALGKDCKGFISASDNVPDWLSARAKAADP